MADQNLNVALTLSAKDSASPTLASVSTKLDQLHSELEAQRQIVPQSSKDWLDYAENISRIAAGVATAGAALASMRLTMLQYDVVKGVIEGVTAVIAKWKGMVGELGDAYQAVRVAVTEATGSLVEATQSGWTAVQLRAEKLEAKIGELGARFFEFGKIASALETAGIVLAIAEIGIKADESNEKTRLLIEAIGGLTAPLQNLDQASKPVELAKERFEELYKASLTLGTPIEELLPTYKAFFDLVDEGGGSIKDNAAALTDFLNVQKSLVFSSAEAATAQQNITAAFEKGVTSVSQLSTIFGSALNPALDTVAAQLGITRDQLQGMINSGQLGTAKVFPALAAAARTLTAPLTSTGDAAAFSKKQFDEMGLSVYDLSASKLPGVTTALQYTAREFPATINAAVDPIGAAVEQIENFGNRIAEWSRLTKQSIADAFSGPDIGKELTTGLQESMYALDLILVSTREGIMATVRTLDVLAGTAMTSADPMSTLDDIFGEAANNISDSRTQLQSYIKALEGVDNASGRTTESTKVLAEAVKTLPTINLPEKLQDIIDKMTATEKATNQVAAAWQTLKGLDFTGTSIRGLLTLRQVIEEISAKTGDAIGTQEQFSKVLAAIPDKQFDALLAKVTALKPQLEEAGDKGQVFGAVMGAAFQKTVEAAALATKAVADHAKSVEGILVLDEKIAANSETIAKALNQEAAAFQSVTEKAQAETAILQASAEKAALHAQTAQAIAASKQAEADASQALYVKLQQELAGIATLTEAETKGLETAKADANQKQIVAAESREVTVAAQLEAAQLTGVAQAHQLSAQGAAVLVGSLGDLKQAYLDAAAKAEILVQNQKDGIATKDQVNAAIAEEIRALSEYNAAVDLTKKAFAQLGLDADQVLTGMDAKFKETIQILQSLAENGKLTGAALKEALQNAIKTADSQAELKALDVLIKKLGEDGKLTGSEMTLALDAVKDKLLQVADATDPVAQAFKVLGIQSHDALNQAAQDAKDAFETIRASGTATTGDLNAAFAAMAEKVMEAGEAAGPVGEAMAVAFLKARAATAEEVAEVEKLIGTYHEAAAAAESSAEGQVAASNQVTAATKSQAAAAQTIGGIQKQQIENYDELSASGKEWVDSLIAQKIATDNARAGTAAYQNVTGQAIQEIENMIDKEEGAVTQIEALQAQFDSGTISARALQFQINQLAAQLGDPITSAGESALKTLRELQQQIQNTTNASTGTGTGTGTGTKIGAGSSSPPILTNFSSNPTEGEIVVMNGTRWQFHRESATIAYWINLDYAQGGATPLPIQPSNQALSNIDSSKTAALKSDLADIHDWLERIDTKAASVGDSIAKSVTSSSYMVQQVVKELQLQAGRAN